MFTRNFLFHVRREALRKRVWFRALDSVERGILYLAGQVCDKITNTRLCVVIVKIMVKLKHSMKSDFERYIESYGVLKARLFIDFSKKFNNVMLKSWAYDIDFVRYLTFLDYNRPSGWGVL